MIPLPQSRIIFSLSLSPSLFTVRIVCRPLLHKRKVLNRHKKPFFRSKSFPQCAPFPLFLWGICWNGFYDIVVEGGRTRRRRKKEEKEEKKLFLPFSWTTHMQARTEWCVASATIWKQQQNDKKSGPCMHNKIALWIKFQIFYNNWRHRAREENSTRVNFYPCHIYTQSWVQLSFVPNGNSGSVVRFDIMKSASPQKDSTQQSKPPLTFVENISVCLSLSVSLPPLFNISLCFWFIRETIFFGSSVIVYVSNSFFLLSFSDDATVRAV